MSLNWKEIDAALDELNLIGAFIQDIVQPSFDSIALFTYKAGAAKTVLIHLAPGVCRIHETRKKIPKTKKPLRFMEFLKAKIRGAKIIDCGQIERERIVKIVCARGTVSDAGNGTGEIILYARLWSNAANIIAVDAAGNIFDTFYRRPKKGEITGGKFSVLTNTTSADISAGTEKPKREYAVRDFAGLRELSAQRGIDFASLSFNQKIDWWYDEYASTLSREALLEQAQKRYNAQRSRMQNALIRLEEKRSEFSHAEQWKHQGDLILSFGHLIESDKIGDSGNDEKPQAQWCEFSVASSGICPPFPNQFLECEDYKTGQTVSIKIDPKKSVQQNAAYYYEAYKKAMSGIDELERDIARAKKNLLDVDALYRAIFAEENPIKMRQLMQKQSTPRQQIQKKRPGVTYEVSGWTIFAGRTAQENDELLRHHVKGQDMWLHTRDWAGGYIFIKHRQGKTVPLDILLDAGNLALYHSKARAQGEADLYYTQVKYLRRAKNAPKGTVLPAQEKNLFIRRDAGRLKRLEECVVESGSD
ncbi:MAG: NFACT family protein [Treponemataceae bacterium]|nr:MAG: NFACT family protein [Treponemataceae bacterium]